jgi:sulfur carrier protein
MMQITLNDQIVEIKAGETIFSIIEKFSFSEEKIAIELDGEIIPKSEFSVTKLKSGSVVEVVEFVGGG